MVVPTDVADDTTEQTGHWKTDGDGEPAEPQQDASLDEGIHFALVFSFNPLVDKPSLTNAIKSLDKT